jgi:hypothetical protein
MFELASLPQELGEIVLQGIRLGSLAFRRLFTLTTVLAFLGLIPTVFLVWGANDTTSFDTPTLDAIVHRFVSPYGLLLCCMTVLGLFPQAMLLKRIALAARGSAEAREVELRQALRLWPWMLLTLIVYSLVVALGMLVIVPGVILAVSLMFAEYGVVLEGLKPIAALNASHNLVWGRWWRTLGLLLLITIPPLLLITILSASLGIDFGSVDNPVVRGRDLFKQAVLEMVFFAFCGPFFYSIMYLYYHDLKLRRQTVH